MVPAPEKVTIREIFNVVNGAHFFLFDYQEK
jgi:hypothetical protein